MTRPVRAAASGWGEGGPATARAALPRRGQRRLMMADIGRAVCEYFGIEWNDLLSRRRVRRVLVPRFLFCLLAREVAGRSLGEIAAFLDGRNHTSIINAVARAKQMIEADAEAARAYLSLLNRIREFE